MDSMTLVDVSVRDGLQNEPAAVGLAAETKVAFLRQLAEVGLERIEAGSFVHPKAVPAMAESEAVARLLAPVQAAFPAVVFSFLVPNLRGLARAAEVGAKEVAVFLALSEEFSQANIRQGVDEAFRDIAPVVQQALQHGMRVRGYISNIFGYQTDRVLPTDVARRSAQLLQLGCFEVSLGDTTAIGTPEAVHALIDALEAAGVPLARIAMHLHDTHGRAVENVAASYARGIRVFDGATGGLGGCPYAHSPKGNVALEDIVAWAQAQGIATPVRNLAALQQVGRNMRTALGKE